jgi:hypothetical protein
VIVGLPSIGGAGDAPDRDEHAHEPPAHPAGRSIAPPGSDALQSVPPPTGNGRLQQHAAEHV